MFLFTIKATINPRSLDRKRLPEIGGAYVNCYISFKDFEVAEQLARLLIRKRGWTPAKKSEAWKLQRSKMRTKKQKQYYEEAIKFGYCLVFHMWSKDAPDADQD